MWNFVFTSNRKDAEKMYININITSVVQAVYHILSGIVKVFKVELYKKYGYAILMLPSFSLFIKKNCNESSS